MRTLLPLLLALLVAPPLSAAELRPVESDPMPGTVTTLSFVEENGLPGVAYFVRARYRENAHETLRSTQELGTTDLAGEVAWTPERPGVVVLAWEKPGAEGSAGSVNISVVHDGFPPGAILIAVFAGLLLLGGSVVFFLQMMRRDKAPAGRELPST